jgi:condensin complex subunit 2
MISHKYVHNTNKTHSRRCYATTEEEEKEAEMSIHQEALERSRASHATMAAAAQINDDYVDDDDDDGYAAPDWGGGGDDEDNDFAFTDFVTADENGARYSSISFQNESVVEEAAPTRTMATRSATTVVLDALCSGETLQGGNDYEFFSTEALDKLLTSGNNEWAGAAHWKKGDALRKKKTAAAAAAKKKKNKKKQSNKKKKTNQVFVDLSTPPPDMKDILRQPPKKKKKGAADPLQLSNAMLTKYDKTDNLLPPDAGIGIEALSTLFLRPNDVMRGGSSNKENGGKTVGKKCLERVQNEIDLFSDLIATIQSNSPFSANAFPGFDANVTSFGGGLDDGSYGDDNDGGGFVFADDDHDEDGQDFVIGELEGVRKVQKIQVGYATTAKKVDVKRLKKDLWTELREYLCVGANRANGGKAGRRFGQRGGEICSPGCSQYYPAKASVVQGNSQGHGGNAGAGRCHPAVLFHLLAALGQREGTETRIQRFGGLDHFAG